MTFVSFIVIALSSTVFAWLLLSLFVVFPAYKSFQQQAAKTSLARCLRKLNEDALKNGKIQHGDYLHDSIYKAVFTGLVVDKRLISVKNWGTAYTRKDELRLRRFQREMQNLDEETVKIFDQATFSLAKLVWLNNLVRFPLKAALHRKEREEYLIKTGQYIVVSEQQEESYESCMASA